jgi:DNA-binding CsgD family transcriptional regulator
MDQRDLLLSMTQKLLHAPGSDEGWQAFMLDLCDALKGSAANFISFDRLANTALIAVSIRTDPEALLLYTRHWCAEDPWAHGPNTHKLVSGAALLGDEMISHTQFRQTAFYNDFARHYDIARAIVANIDSNPRTISAFSVNGTEGRGAFDEEDRRLLEALMGPLRRAIELHRRLTGAEAIGGGLTNVVDRLPHGMLLLSARRRILYVNRTAEEILRLKDGLIIDGGELRAAGSDGTARLRTIIGNAIRISAGELIDGATAGRIERPSGKRPPFVMAAPLPGQPETLGVEPAAVALFVTDPESNKPATDVATLRAIFGLTRAEAQLLLMLLEGLPLQQTAERLHLSAETARSHLKSIFQKTDTHRQADLIRRVLITVAPRTSDF